VSPAWHEPVSRHRPCWAVHAPLTIHTLAILLSPSCGGRIEAPPTSDGGCGDASCLDVVSVIRDRYAPTLDVLNETGLDGSALTDSLPDGLDGASCRRDGGAQVGDCCESQSDCGPIYQLCCSDHVCEFCIKR
jgi:hypothetical protein